MYNTPSISAELHIPSGNCIVRHLMWHNRQEAHALLFNVFGGYRFVEDTPIWRILIVAGRTHDTIVCRGQVHSCQCVGEVFYIYLIMFCLFHDKNVLWDCVIFGKYHLILLGAFENVNSSCAFFIVFDSHHNRHWMLFWSILVDTFKLTCGLP